MRNKRGIYDVSYSLLPGNTMVSEHLHRDWAVAALCVAVLWLGLLLGVAFLATPVKFLAPSLTLPVALDVGRHTFAVFNKVEWALCVALLLPVLFGARTWLSICAAVAIVLLVAVETVWLLPLLDQRVGLIIAGGQPAASSDHNLYIALDGAKLVALIVVAWVMVYRVVQSAPIHDRSGKAE
jgi:hypothetical protein